MIIEPPANNATQFRSAHARSSMDASILASAVEFRVFRDGSPARRLRINTNRCTIGSGEGCTVRLCDSSLRPMHAVLLQDAERILLRAYTVPIEVNGHLTGETFLHAGDSFVLGSYQFELIQSEPAEGTATGSLSFRGDTAPDAEVDFVPPAPRQRARLSFSGGSAYISEAVQAPAAPAVATFHATNQRAALRQQTEQLRREVESYRNRERQWQEQEADRLNELNDAIARIHQSQAQAKDASDAVEKMRKRMTQLSEELETLAADSQSFREQSAQHREEYLRQITIATEAHQEAIHDRDEARRLAEQAIVAQRELSAQRDRWEHDFWNRADQSATEQSENSRQIISLQEQIAVGEQQVAAATARLGQTEETLRDVSQLLATSNENLRLTRQQDENSQASIASLSAEVREQRQQLERIDQASLHSTSQDELLDQLRAEILRLQEECAIEQRRAELAGDGKKTIENLKSQLIQAETRTASERLSWEQEAASLHDTIRQLSMDVATASSHLSDTEAEHDVSRTELNDAYERLTTVRRELAERPTIKQWDDLQEQLVETERQLAQAEEQLTQAEQQLGRVRSDYDVLLNRSSTTETTSSASLGYVATHLAKPEPELATENPPSASLIPANDDKESDHGWPAYYSASPVDAPDEPAASIIAELSSEAESIEGKSHDDNLLREADSFWASSDATVVDRLPSYATRNGAHRLPLAPPENRHGPFDPSDDLVDPAPQSAWTRPIAEPLAEASFDELPPVTSEPESISGAMLDEPSMGRIAKQLIEQLSSASANDPRLGDPSVSQSIGSWVDSSTAWKRIAQGDNEDVSESNDVSEYQDAKSFSGHESVSHGDPTEEDSFTEQRGWNDSSLNHDAADDRRDASYESMSNSDDDAYPRGTANSYSYDDATEEADDYADKTFLFSAPTDLDIEEETYDHYRSHSVSSLDDHLGDGVTDQRSSPNLSESKQNFDVMQSERVTAVDVETYPTKTTAIGATQEPANTDDDSIEAYMNRLLQRVQGHSGAGGSAPTSVEMPKVEAAKPVEQSPQTVSVSQTHEVIDPNAPIIPRSQAPEDAGNLAAMRELANASANSAISTSVRGQAEKMKSGAIMDLFQAGIILVCAFAFYTCGDKIPSLSYVWYTASGLAVALAFFFIIDMMKKLAVAKQTCDAADSVRTKD